MDLTTARETFPTEVRTGFGPTRKTRKSAEREAQRWNESGDGTAYLRERRTNASPVLPARWEEVVAEARPVEGGYACAYVTSVTPVEVLV